MPQLALATLAAGAQDNNGLISMLGGFIEAVQGPQLPIRQQLWFVGRVLVSEAEIATGLVLVVRAEHTEDAEQLARVETTVTSQAPPGLPEGQLIGVNLIVPLTLEFRREGEYRVTVSANGDLVGKAPLRVTAQLPAV